jgi:hypothetical protein
MAENGGIGGSGDEWFGTSLIGTIEPCPLEGCVTSIFKKSVSGIYISIFKLQKNPNIIITSNKLLI